MANVKMTRKAGSEDTEEVTVSATGLDNLDGVTAGQWFMWNQSTGTLVIDGLANGAAVDGPGFAVKDSADRIVELDPQTASVQGANAFADEGTYRATLKLIFADGRPQFWPDEGYLEIKLEHSMPQAS